MGIEFFLDITTSFLLMLYRCRSGSNQLLDSELQIKLFFNRILIGFTINVSTFIVICLLNKDEVLEGIWSNVMFGVIIIQILVMYVTDLCVAYTVRHQISGSVIYIMELIANYRLCDVIFDILILIYTLVLSRWQLTVLVISVLIFSLLDVTLNLILYVKTLLRIHRIERGENTIATNIFYTACICPMRTVIGLCCGCYKIHNRYDEIWNTNVHE